MVTRSSLDPLEEARARVRLRSQRALPLAQGAKPLGMMAMRVTRKKLPKKGATLARIRANWSDIVGENIARLCLPEKLTGSKDGRILTLRVIPAAAGLVQHQSETIRQRISVSAGGDIVTLKLIQGSLRFNAKSATRPAMRALTPGERGRLSEMVMRLNDKKLQQAAYALGEALYSRQNDPVDEG